jgi:hypothetical protein
MEVRLAFRVINWDLWDPIIEDFRLQQRAKSSNPKAKGPQKWAIYNHLQRIFPKMLKEAPSVWDADLHELRKIDKELDKPPGETVIGTHIAGKDIGEKDVQRYSWLDRAFMWPECLEGLEGLALTKEEGLAGLELFWDRNERGLPRPTIRLVKWFAKLGSNSGSEAPSYAKQAAASILSFAQEATVGTRDRAYRLVEGAMAYRPWESDRNKKLYQEARSQWEKEIEGPRLSTQIRIAPIRRIAREGYRTELLPQTTGILIGGFTAGVWSDLGVSFIAMDLNELFSMDMAFPLEADSSIVVGDYTEAFYAENLDAYFEKGEERE